MGRTLCLQSWTTVTGSANTVVQDESCWVDIGSAKDVAIYTEVALVTTTGTNVTLQVQTSPVRENGYFDANLTPGVGPPVPLAGYLFTTSPASPVQPIQIVRFANVTASAGPSRFLRWRIVFTGATDEITFRIWVNVNEGGR